VTLLIRTMCGVLMTSHAPSFDFICTVAFGFVQSGKRQKKFLAFPDSTAWIALADASRYVYVYKYVAYRAGGHRRSRG